MRHRSGVATEVRNTLYGGKTLPFPAPLRDEWADVCCRLRSSGSLLAEDVYRVAETFAAELRQRGPLTATPDVDLALRLELGKRLLAEAKRLNRPRLTAAQRREGRIKTLAKG